MMAHIVMTNAANAFFICSQALRVQFTILLSDVLNNFISMLIYKLQRFLTDQAHISELVFFCHTLS